MGSKLKTYIKSIRARLDSGEPIEDPETFKTELLREIGFWQHERLIHLMVTMLFALLTMMVLLVAKMLGRLPLVSFWGRYSIIILCIHSLLIIVLNWLLGRYLSGSVLLFAVFVLTMFLCHLLLPLVKRYLPHVTAQKDVIKV